MVKKITSKLATSVQLYPNRKQSHGLGGKAPRKLTQEEVEKVAELSKYFISQERIAMALGLTHDHFIAIKKKQPEVTKICENMKMYQIKAVTESLMYKAIVEKDIRAIEMVLKCKGDWREPKEYDSREKANHIPNFNINFISQDNNHMKPAITISDATKIENREQED
jgi:hypothetical protein